MLIVKRTEQRECRWKHLVSLLVNQGQNSRGGVTGQRRNRGSLMFLVLRDIYTPNEIKCTLVI